MGTIQAIILVILLGLAAGAGLLPDGVNAVVGGNVYFNTSLNPTQTPFISISWQIGTKTIIMSNNVNSTSAEYEGRITLFISTGSLELRNVALSDNGEYSVTIIPPGAAQRVGTTTLQVYEKVSRLCVSVSSSDLVEFDSSMTLSCSASGSSLSFGWLNGSHEITASDRVSLTDRGATLTIATVRRSDQGLRCQVSNPVSNSTSEPMYLNIMYGPEKVQISGRNEVLLKTTLRLSCSAKSLPAASYIWKKNGTIVARSSEYTKDKTELSDSGDYICQATNDLSMKTSEESHRVLVTAPKDKLSAGAISGMTIACLVAVVGAVVGGFLIHKYHTGKIDKSDRADGPTERNPSRKSNNCHTEEHVYENPSILYDRNL